jgi:carbon-monoxide dehydrogenase large subunit
VHSDLGTNECYVWKLDAGEAEAAIDAADVVVTQRYYQPRLIPNAMEPREFSPRSGRRATVTLWSATQTPHIQRFVMQLVFGIPESKIRVIAPDVGVDSARRSRCTPKGRSRSRWRGASAGP